MLYFGKLWLVKSGSCAYLFLYRYLTAILTAIVKSGVEEKVYHFKEVRHTGAGGGLKW